MAKVADGSHDEPVVGRGEIVSAKDKNGQNELAMSSRTRPVTHLSGPPTSQVPPSYIVPIQQRKVLPQKARSCGLRTACLERG